MTIDEQIEILQAIKAGKIIQWKRNCSTQWVDCGTMPAVPDFARFEYRIKPDPKTLEVWINIYDDGGVAMYTKKENAYYWSFNATRIARKRVKVEYVDGELE